MPPRHQERALIQEEEFSSDEDLDEEANDSDSSTDVEAKLAEEEVFDLEFFKCYSALKKKDDKIYDKNVRFFEDKSADEDENDDDDIKAERGVETDEAPEDEQGPGLSREQTTRAPRMTLLDHQFGLKDDEIEEPDKERHKVDLNQPISKSFYERELEEIKKNIEQVGKTVDSDSDDELFITKKTPSAEEDPQKSRSKISWILDRIENDEEENQVEFVRQLWTDSKSLSNEDKFLRDYILNKLYLPPNQDKNGDETNDDKEEFFSKNIDELSDVDEEGAPKSTKKKPKAEHHFQEKDFDQIVRVPRNSTKTIRDIAEKREKKEKRFKKLEKEKKKKQKFKDADFEDVVGDLPIKFHYRQTEPNDYGLSAEELLMATDEELEKWCKLHDAIGYKTVEEERATKAKFERRRNDTELKKKIFKSIYGSDEPSTSGNEGPAKKGTKRARERVNEGEPEHNDDDEVALPDANPGDPEPQIDSKKKKKRRRGTNHKKFAKVGVAPDRLLAYGLSKNKLKKSKLL